VKYHYTLRILAKIKKTAMSRTDGNMEQYNSHKFSWFAMEMNKIT
jgi:hypothetical protein